MTSITTNGVKKILKYDAENRLISVEPEKPVNGSLKVYFFYDYMGRRVKKNVGLFNGASWSQSKEVLFVWNGWNLVKKITNEGGNQTIRYWVWGLDLAQSLKDAGGIGGLVACVDGSKSYYFAYDGNGNINQVIDSSDGSVVAAYRYDPYGNIISASGIYADKNPFRFSTKYYDVETGLVYYGLRFYSPKLGRWLNRDPIGEEGGPNLYVFVVNNSITVTDFLGLRKIYLQFDDPPIGGTKTVLAALTATSSKATFFIVGQHMKEMGSGIVKKIVSAGHTIGNHSYSHWYKNKDTRGKASEQWVADFIKGEVTIFEATGKRPKLARIPGNQPQQKKDVTEALQNKGWKVLGWDWEIGKGADRGDPKQPAQNAKTIDEKNYTNILMHPQEHMYSGAKSDLICFINNLKQRGHTIESLPYEERAVDNSKN